MRIVLAFRAFFAVLFNKSKAVQVEKLLLASSADISSTPPTRIPAPSVQEVAPTPPTPRPTPVAKSGRSEALTLLSTLQREARFIDLVQESLDQYSDTQIGAAARDVLRDTKKSLETMFGLKPLAEQAEGERVQLPDAPSPIRWKLVGAVQESGVLVHPGWVAAKVELPTWSGKPEDQWIVAPAEVEA